MKVCVLLLIAIGCAMAMEIPTYQQNYKTNMEKPLLHYQKELLDLLKNVYQPHLIAKHVDMAKTYSIEDNLNMYMNVDAVKHFVFLYKTGMLPKDRIFSIFYKEQLKEAIALFRVFYYAKDLETLFRTAIWARLHCNEGMFVYALSCAICQRPDTNDLILPAIYEVWPHYFFSSGVITKAQKYKQMYTGGTKYGMNFVRANYTGWYLNVEPEQSLSYFTEDVGLNAYYYYYNLFYPFWMGGEEFHSVTKTWNRGEQFFYFYQQLMARYYMERLSNDIGEIPQYDYEAPFEVGYTSSLMYPNGLMFPDRSTYVSFFKNYFIGDQSATWKGEYPYSLTRVKDIERRIRDAIDRGYVMTRDGRRIPLYDTKGMETLGNLIQSNPDSPNNKFYGMLLMFARHLLGYTYQPLDKYMVVPSALQHFETSLRDPAFWMLYKRMMLHFYKYKYNLPKYSYDDLALPGVKIENVNVDRLVTYFDYFDSDITNSVFMNEQETVDRNSFTVLARQKRLNHKPFSYRIVVNSDKPVKSIVRVFIGPKFDEYDRKIKISENRMNFFEIDKFVYELQSGKNTIERNSRELMFADDMTSYKQIYQMVMGVNTGDRDFKSMKEKYLMYAFPRRMILPMGKIGGQVFQFYVMVSQYRQPTTKNFEMVSTMSNPLYNSERMDNSDRMGRMERMDRLDRFERMDRMDHFPERESTFKWSMKMTPQDVYDFGPWTQNIDDYPLGYPFDRYIVNKKTFLVPNSYFQDVIIYHKNMDDVNTVRDNTRDNIRENININI